MIYFDSSNPNLYSTKIIMKIRWQTIASSVSMRTISPTATQLPTAYDCVAVYIAGRRTRLVVYDNQKRGSISFQWSQGSCVEKSDFPPYVTPVVL